MGRHKYGQYLHILTPAGSDYSHDGPKPWEGITGRVKQETNRLLGVIEKKDTANKEAIKGVESKLEANKEAIKGVESKLEAQETKLEAQLGDVQSQLKSIEALLASLVAENQ